MRNPMQAATIARAGLNMISKHNATPTPSPYGGRGYATPVDQVLQKEYAFELAASNIRYGEGVTQEVGMDFEVSGTCVGCIASRH